MIITSAALASTKHAFFTRQGGVSQGLYASLNGGVGSQDEAEHVIENRCLMAAHMGVAPERFLSLYQIHSPTVITVTDPWSVEKRPQADAMVTREKGLALAIATADCGPVLFVDAKAGVIGAAHAGWKGAYGGVLEATINAMELLGATRSHITAVIGPTISAKAYEVGPEFVERLTSNDKTYARFFTLGLKDRSHFDLPAFIRYRLEVMKLSAIDDIKACTLSDEARFYSYRRATLRGEPDYGRLISAILL
jgi:polyphenol oxidase